MVKTLPKNNDEWTVDFETHSRDDVMKVCALLAKGIGEDNLLNNPNFIQIIGPTQAGKSAISDGLVAAFLKPKKSYCLSLETLIEEFPGEAKGKVIERNFDINGSELLVAFAHMCEPTMDLRNGFHFFTEINPIDFEQKGISINFDILFNPKYRSWIDSWETWKRKWSIKITDPNLQTPEMAEILHRLRAFHQRRQARLNAQADLLAEPI